MSSIDEVKILHDFLEDGFTGLDDLDGPQAARVMQQAWEMHKHGFCLEPEIDEWVVRVELTAEGRAFYGSLATVDVEPREPVQVAKLLVTKELQVSAWCGMTCEVGKFDPETCTFELSDGDNYKLPGNGYRVPTIWVVSVHKKT